MGICKIVNNSTKRGERVKANATEVFSRLVNVIETKFCTGSGTTDDPVRHVIQYRRTDGTLLAEIDPYLGNIAEAASSASSASM